MISLYLDNHQFLSKLYVIDADLYSENYNRKGVSTFTNAQTILIDLSLFLFITWGRLIDSEFFSFLSNLDNH